MKIRIIAALAALWGAQANARVTVYDQCVNTVDNTTVALFFVEGGNARGLYQNLSGARVTVEINNTLRESVSGKEVRCVKTTTLDPITRKPVSVDYRCDMYVSAAGDFDPDNMYCGGGGGGGEIGL